jgi:hypothetical protein
MAIKLVQQYLAFNRNAIKVSEILLVTEVNFLSNQNKWCFSISLCNNISLESEYYDNFNEASKVRESFLIDIGWAITV